VTGAGGPGDVLRLGGRSFGPRQRLVMAIVNRTPDSFYDRGATWDEAAAMDRVHAVVAEGADILDIGGVPAAPGAEVTVAEEIRRTVPFVAAVRAAHPRAGDQRGQLSPPGGPRASRWLPSR
jgi:dihydropteroate synthase